ncbi:MAG: thiamine diphosphokinase, partial [Candidatus Cloacimonetes bacterium]|nr:thiamine diphosphokinase [Candidatus Cloacimonadota bacterium]
IGDLDSVSDDALNILAEQIEILEFPPEKEKTDSEIALDYCVEKGFDTVTMVNAVNGRLDHSLANIFLAESFLQKGLSLYFINRKNEIFVLHDQDEINFQEQIGAEISLIPLSQQVFVKSTAGLKYQLKDEILYRDRSRGVSNVASDNKITIRISSGILLIIRGR